MKINAMALEQTLRPDQTPAQAERARAEDVANQFEAVFVRTLVGSLRQTASLGGESGDHGGVDPSREPDPGGADAALGGFDCRQCV